MNYLLIYFPHNKIHLWGGGGEHRDFGGGELFCLGGCSVYTQSGPNPLLNGFAELS